MTRGSTGKDNISDQKSHSPIFKQLNFGGAYNYMDTKKAHTGQRGPRAIAFEILRGTE